MEQEKKEQEMKEQEQKEEVFTVVPEVEGDRWNWYYVCSECHGMIVWNQKRCKWCNGRIDWNA